MLLENQRIKKLANLYGFDPANLNDSKLLEALHLKSILTIKERNGKLLEESPLEKHPYLVPLVPDNKIKGIMIGTFPPISYLCDSLKLKRLTFQDQEFTQPNISYFHGNKNSLWEQCPINFERIANNIRETKADSVKSSLYKSGIIYTDIIKYVKRDLETPKGLKYTANDRNLSNIIIHEEIYKYIFENKSIDRIYFTNSSFFGSKNANNHLFKSKGNFNLVTRDAFRLFLKGASDYGIKIDYSPIEDPNNWININEYITPKNIIHLVNNTLHTKVIIRLKLSLNEDHRYIDAYSCLSPAAIDRGKVRKNQCVINYSRLNNVNIETSPKGLLKNTLNAFFNNNPTNIIHYNS